MRLDNWFTAIVTNLADPLNAGRVQIRCYEYHTTDEGDLPDVDLPWALPLLPVTSASSGGTGTSATGLLVGSWVFGFFRDVDNQDPVIIGSIPGVEALNGQGIPDTATSSSIGIAATSLYSSGAPIGGPADTSTLDPDIPTISGATNSEIARNLVNIARTQVGEKNGSKYLGGGLPWCAAFVAYCLVRSGVPKEDLPSNPNFSWSYKEWAKGKGSKYVALAADNTYQPGDIIIRHRGAVGSGFGHIGIISVGCNDRRNEAHSTIEGNTGSPRGVYERSKKYYWPCVLRWKSDLDTPLA
jgi:hypothetical protein